MKRGNRTIPKLRMAGDPILTEVCEPINPDDDVDQISRDMMYLLTHSKTGVGIAAPQAGHAKRMMIIYYNGQFNVLINPRIISHQIDVSSQREYCLSYPGRSRIVARYRNILVEWYNENFEDCTNRMISLEARIFLHELDHLNGKCAVSQY